MEETKQKHGDHCRAPDKANKMLIHIKAGSDGDPEQHFVNYDICGLGQDDIKTDSCEALSKFVLTKIRQRGDKPDAKGFGDNAEVHEIL